MEIPIKPTPTTEKFILHWGEMGSRWGVNRTVSQIQALLYLFPMALNAETIGETLGGARSNVSTSLKIFQSWELVRVVQLLGDRRDYFESHKDVWGIFFAGDLNNPVHQRVHSLSLGTCPP